MQRSALSGLTLEDVLYVVFRHKWKIILISLAGVALAAVLPWVMPRLYLSEARLYIPYVVEVKSPGQVGNDSKIKSADERGDNIINTEVEIVTSVDLMQKVVDTIGPERITGKHKAKDQRKDAIEELRENLTAEVPKKSNVIRVSFQDEDPQLVQPVLREVIANYLKRHEEIHRPVGVFDEFLTQEIGQRRARLKQIEEELKKTRKEAGVLSIEDTKKANTEQISKVRQDIFNTEAELAARRASVAELSKALNGRAATNSPTEASAGAGEALPLAEYTRVCNVLENLGKREQELLVQFTPENSLVRGVREQIAANEKLKQQLEARHPALLRVRAVESRSVAVEGGGGPKLDLAGEQTQVMALESKLGILTNQLAGLRKEASLVEEAEATIRDLQVKRDLEEAQYRYFSGNLEQSRIDERLGAGRLSNISIVQAPSPPVRVSSKLMKLMAALILGAIGSAFALAFAIELYLDRSIRRPVEVERRIGRPLFVSIPAMRWNGKANGLGAGKRTALLAQRAGAGNGAGQDQRAEDNRLAETGELEVTGRGPKAELHPFSEALRDRLITYFEMNEMTHKPKLVGITSCAEGSGVSTVAAGLAASLSETGEGNVLLVDMNRPKGATHQFHRGEISCGLEEALEGDRRDSALVQDRLYLATEAADNEKLPRLLPARFKALVPRLKASDYDYIIFDLPPVSQISVTPRLARFMDMVLMVLESEKTGSETAMRANELLSESQAHVGVVLNKTHSYLPTRFQEKL